MGDIRTMFSDCSDILDYLTAVRNDVVENADQFATDQQEQPMLPFVPPRAQQESWFNRYAVNVLSEPDAENCAPVVIEDNPTYQNLIGRIEYRAEFGAMVTDFTQIRAGALHRANGGYLVLEARNLLQQGLAWDGLKRALRNREIKVESIGQFFGLVSAATLEPEPIPLNVKVVMIGEEWLYQLLNMLDEDFRREFKVKAEFQSTMPRTPQAVREYASFIGDLVRRANLRHFDAGAVAQVVEEASRMADDRETHHADGQRRRVRQAYWADRRAHAGDRRGRRARGGRADYRLSHIAEQFVERIGEAWCSSTPSRGRPGNWPSASPLELMFGVLASPRLSGQGGW